MAMFRVTCKDLVTGKLFPVAMEGVMAEEAMAKVRAMGLYPQGAVADAGAPFNWTSASVGAGSAAEARPAGTEMREHEVLELLARSDMVRSIGRSAIITNPVRTVATGVVAGGLMLWGLSMLFGLLFAGIVQAFSK